jgi:hypothetical protein
MPEPGIGQQEDDRAFQEAWLKAARPRYIGSAPPPHRTDLWMVGLARELWDAGMKRGLSKRGCCREDKPSYFELAGQDTK